MEGEEENYGIKSPLVGRGLEEGFIVEENGSNNKIEEIKKQLLLAGPIVAVNVLLNCLSVISVMFVGHLGELPLAGASMATSFASVSGFSLLVIFFCSLSCGPDGNGKCTGHILWPIIWSKTIPYAWHSQAEGNASSPPSKHTPSDTLGKCRPYFSLLRPRSGDFCRGWRSGAYARVMIPSIFPYALLQCHIRFLQSQKNLNPMMLSTGFTTLLHIFVCWILVFKSGLGSKGSALANAISYWVNMIILAIYVRMSNSCKETWTGFTKEGLQEIPKFIRLAIPSAMMLCLEAWSFEMMVLLSGLLPNPKLETSVLSISLNTGSLFYMIPLGFSGATSIRVSNELGAGKYQAARLAICVALGLVFTEGLLVATVILLGRNIWGYLYSKEEEVVKYVGQMLVLVAVTYGLDGIQSVLSGATRGCGLQKIGALVNLGAYYLIGLPSGIFLAFVCHIRGQGLWTGLMVALFMQALFLAIIALCTNWENEAKKASERVFGSRITAQLP